MLPLPPALLRPLLVQRYRLLSAAPPVCRPHGAPQAHAHGADPDRILLFGSGVATGRGVASHELAVPGQLARAISGYTGRGADVDVIGDDHIDIESATATLAGRDLRGYDAVVVTIGMSDAFRLLPARRWVAGLVALLEVMEREFSAGTSIVIMGVPPLSSIPELHARPGGLGDEWADRLNRLTRGVCEKQPHVHFAEAPRHMGRLLDRIGSGPGALGRRSKEWFREWAAVPAAVLVPLLEAQSAPDRPSRVARNEPQAADRRRATLWEMRLLDSPAESRFDEIVRHAQAMFGAAGAAFSVVDDDRQWNKSFSGAGVREVPIEESFCRTTISSATALVVADAWSDARVPGVGAAMRFYAGYPVEAADGTRIGALCVFDEDPRPADTVDVALLRDLALAIQRELEPARV